MVLQGAEILTNQLKRNKFIYLVKCKEQELVKQLSAVCNTAVCRRWAYLLLYLEVSCFPSCCRFSLAVHFYCVWVCVHTIFRSNWNERSVFNDDHWLVSIYLSRGAHMDGGAAQQHRAHKTATVSGCKSALRSLWLLDCRRAAIGRHQPIRELRARTVLPLQEVPPSQHSR